MLQGLTKLFRNAAEHTPEALRGDEVPLLWKTMEIQFRTSNKTKKGTL